MTAKFLKSTTAIVLSLSLAVPSVTMAQTAAELEAALDVDTSNMTEAELDVLREQYAEQQAQAATEAAPEAEEDKGVLGRAVGAVTEGLPDLTGTSDAEPTNDAAPQAAENANETSPVAEGAPEDTAEAETDTPATEAAPQATAEATGEEITDPEAGASVDAETTAEATASTEVDAESTADAEVTPEATRDAPVETTQEQSQTPEATSEDGNTLAEALDNGRDNIQSQVDELRSQLDALTDESAEAQATRQAAAEAEAAETAATSMAAAADADEGAAEVVEETVTEETARSSSEEFATSASANAEASGETEEREGLSDIGKIALFGLGALAVGQILKNGSEVVSNSGDRVVVQQADGSYKVLKNDDVLMFQPGTDVKTYAYDDGSTRTVATREDGTQIETIRAADGTVLRRTRVLANGDRVVLFDDTQVAQQVEVNTLPQVTESERSVNFQQAEADELRAALEARMPSEVDRRFSLSQVRNITAVRGLVPEIDVDNITFETGSSTIRPQQAEELAQLGSLMREQIDANPGNVFLIEGHTDAVGSASYNLALSDRRAESVALALTEYFDVPPENMVVQGYGESDLKVRTADAERLNRRASVRNITPLLSGS